MEDGDTEWSWKLVQGDGETRSLRVVSPDVIGDGDPGDPPTELTRDHGPLRPCTV